MWEKKEPCDQVVIIIVIIIVMIFYGSISTQKIYQKADHSHACVHVFCK